MNLLLPVGEEVQHGMLLLCLLFMEVYFTCVRLSISWLRRSWDEFVKLNSIIRDTIKEETHH